MARFIAYIGLTIIIFSAFAQLKQGKKYYDSDSNKIKEIYHYSLQDSMLYGSYESFYFNGSLQTYGWYEKNLPDSLWRYYYENGRKKAIGRFKAGKPDGKWEYYFENGNLKSKGILRGVNKEGFWTFYYENDGEKSNGNYFNNQKSGIWNYFYEDGSIKAQAYLESGKGKYTEFYPSGARRMEGFNQNEKSIGEWIYYYESGEIEAIGSFENGLKTGVWTYYHKNGVIAGEGLYDSGVRTGDWKYYHDNGNISQSGKIINNQKDGYWKLFYPSGELLGEADFSQGTGDYNEYYPSGSRKSKGQLVNGKKEGKWYYYGENGNLEGEATMTNGEGEYIGYYADGTVKMKGRLKDDKRIGEWTLFNPDGTTAGTYHPIYEDETPIFKTRISEDELERGQYDKPDYRYKRRESRYFQPTINEYRGIIVGSNPLWLIDNQLPLALEYYMQERLGYELQIDILRNPFFTSDDAIADYEIYRRGAKIHFRQKFYSPDAKLGMLYFGHQLSFKYLNHQVNHIDTLIIQQPRRFGNMIETGIGYGIFVGNRWMKDVGNAGFTIDLFLGVSVMKRNFNKQYEPLQVLDNYFDREIKSNIHFPVLVGLNFGLVGPKSKSKTQ